MAVARKGRVKEATAMSDSSAPGGALIDRLGSFAMSSLGIDKIKIGRGVIGNLARVLVALEIVCVVGIAAGVALGDHLIVVGSIATAAIAVLLFCAAAFRFAHIHPDIALLDGAELVRVREIEMAARGMIIPVSQPNETPPPMITSTGTGDE
jgi:hypothetical protein